MTHKYLAAYLFLFGLNVFCCVAFCLFLMLHTGSQEAHMLHSF